MRYFYGVATHPDYRKQGLCGGLLAACCRWMAEQGEAAALLRPDSEKNRQFYRKNGFADCSTVGWGNLPQGAERPCPALRLNRSGMTPSGEKWPPGDCNGEKRGLPPKRDG